MNATGNNQKVYYNFPDSEGMKLLLDKIDWYDPEGYLEEKGIIDDIRRLAIERFANKSFYKVVDVQMGIVLILNDLGNGMDGFTGNKIDSNFHDLPTQYLGLIQKAVEEALLENAQKSSTRSLAGINEEASGDLPNATSSPWHSHCALSGTNEEASADLPNATSSPWYNRCVIL